MSIQSPAKVIGLDDYRSNTHRKDPINIESISALALKLQPSIEITPLMNTFCEETAKLVPCDSVTYTHDAEDLRFNIGLEQAHHCNYELVLEGELLGEVLCSRKKPFSMKIDNRISALQQLAC